MTRAVLLHIHIFLAGCAAQQNAAPDVENTLRLTTLVSSREIDVKAFDHNPFSGQVYFIGLPPKKLGANATLYRLDLRTRQIVEVYRDFGLDYRDIFVAALRDGGVMVFRGDAEYSLLTFYNDALHDRLDVVRERELGEGLPIFLADKKTKNPERLRAVERNCREFARQSPTIEPIGQVLYRFGDRYEIIPHYMRIKHPDSGQAAALNVSMCGGYDFYAEFAGRITAQPDTLWNPDALGDVKLFKSAPHSETWRTDMFQIPNRQFTIRYVSPSSRALHRVYHNFACEQYVNQIFYGGNAYQTEACIRMIHNFPTSRYLFSGDDFLLLFSQGIVKGSR